MALFSIVTAANTTITLDGSNGVTVTQAYGMGMPPMSNQVTDYAVLDGGSFQRAQAKPRVMMLQIEASGNALTGTNGLHTIRARLLSALNPHRAQPMRLNYTGNSGTRYINAYYEAGLDGGDLAGFTEQMTLRLLAPDPYWKANTATATTMANRAAQVFNHVGSWTDGVWSSMGGGMASGGGDVHSMAAKPGGGVYVGGTFDTAGATSAQGIAVWSATGGWTELGGGVTRGGSPHDVRAIEVAPNGDVYIGGLFTIAGATAARSIACRDVSAGAWTALNGGFETGATVHALTILSDGTLYAGGNFHTAGATAAKAIAKWSGTRWSACDTGMPSGYVTCLARDDSDNVYAGGTFVTAGSIAAVKVAKWDGSNWSTLGSGFGASVTSFPYALAYDHKAGYLYAGGTFTTAGGVECLHVARWDGRQWEPLGGGVNNVVWELHVLENGWLLAGGAFTLVNGDSVLEGAVSARRSALWNGYSWVPLPHDLASTMYAFAEDDTSGAWYFGGTYSAGTQYVSARKTISNSGTARAYPVITIAAAAASQRLLYIRNDTTDQTMWFDYLLQDGETLTIDCTPGAKSVTSSYYGTAVGNNPLPGSQLATFALAPGDNSISTLVDGASTTVTFTYRATYWGLD